MDKPTSKERVQHVLDAISTIKEYIYGVNESDFLTNSKLQNAIQYKFVIIGEAIRNIDDEILNKYKYPWHIPRSFRNFIVHEYHGIKLERIFYAAQDLTELEKQMNNILKNEF